MPNYRVHLTYPCYLTLEIEADTAEQAADVVFDHEDMPGGLTYRAFNESPDGPHVDGSDEWFVTEVSDLDGKTLLHAESIGDALEPPR